MIFILLAGSGCVKDDEPPMITPQNQTVEYNSEISFSDLAAVSDNGSEEIIISILSSEFEGMTVNEENQTVLFTDVGKYEIELSAKDEAGNISEDKVLVEVTRK